MAAKRRKKVPGPLPVVIRYEGEGRADRPDWSRGDILAVFPSLPGTNDPATMESYNLLGSHNSCHDDYVRERTKPATPEQVRAALQGLRNAGYKHLRVLQRISRDYYQVRKRAIAR